MTLKSTNTDLPTNEEISNLIQSGDVFRISISGVSAIELALELLISESLLTSHRVELSRLSIDFKVDLSIGLGLLHSDSKGLLVKLSKIRNFYAHSFDIGVDFCPHTELRSCFSKSHRSFVGDRCDTASNFLEAVRISFIAAYHELVQLIEFQRLKRIQRSEALLHVRAVLEATEPADKEEHKKTLQSKAYAELNNSVEEKKKEILSRGNQK
ncbi:MAG: hypothetical protein Q7T48_12145 [Cellvibrio sp.]|uniref:hypothetical protein n=1 Tax=Cellvibrio sp. TaxID=1965322 RepID=UPI0027275AAA|nr:hypothetical protein [Cellvibrio sp.]